jgi:arginyl-tRNA synthetase
MAARNKGTVLILDELIDKIVAEARAIDRGENPELAGKDEIAEPVGIGAIVFNS